MMVDTQVRPSDVTKFPIIDAMLDTPREAFVPEQLREAAYVGENLDLGGGRTLLEPRTLAKIVDALTFEPSDVVLDIACGLGYSTAIAAQLSEFVIGVEDNEARAAEAQSILSELGIDNAAIVSGPLKDGAAKSGYSYPNALPPPQALAHLRLASHGSDPKYAAQARTCH